ncbi:hypothetical protein BST45_20605, partial [Mycobacterium shinjukuense]
PAGSAGTPLGTGRGDGDIVGPLAARTTPAAGSAVTGGAGRADGGAGPAQTGGPAGTAGSTSTTSPASYQRIDAVSTGPALTAR